MHVRLAFGDFRPALAGDLLIHLVEDPALREVVAPRRADPDRVGLDGREIERLVEVDLHVLRGGDGREQEERRGKHCT